MIAKLHKNKRSRFQVGVNALISGVKSSHDRAMAYIEISGSPQAVEGIRARIGTRRERKSRTDYAIGTGIHLDTQSEIMIAPKAKYIAITKISECRTMATTAMLHEELTEMKRSTILGGTKETPSPWFSAAINMIDVPTLPHWLPTLWAEGQNKYLVRQLETVHGPITAWSIQPNASKWQELVSKLIKDGAINIEKVSHG